MTTSKTTKYSWEILLGNAVEKYCGNIWQDNDPQESWYNLSPKKDQWQPQKPHSTIVALNNRRVLNLLPKLSVSSLMTEWRIVRHMFLILLNYSKSSLSLCHPKDNNNQRKKCYICRSYLQLQIMKWVKSEDFTLIGKMSVPRSQTILLGKGF